MDHNGRVQYYVTLHNLNCMKKKWRRLVVFSPCACMHTTLALFVFIMVQIIIQLKGLSFPYCVDNVFKTFLKNKENLAPWIGHIEQKFFYFMNEIQRSLKMNLIYHLCRWNYSQEFYMYLWIRECIIVYVAVRSNVTDSLSWQYLQYFGSNRKTWIFSGLRRNAYFT